MGCFDQTEDLRSLLTWHRVLPFSSECARQLSVKLGVRRWLNRRVYFSFETAALTRLGCSQSAVAFAAFDSKATVARAFAVDELRFLKVEVELDVLNELITEPEEHGEVFGGLT